MSDIDYCLDALLADLQHTTQQYSTVSSTFNSSGTPGLNHQTHNQYYYNNRESYESTTSGGSDGYAQIQPTDMNQPIYEPQNIQRQVNTSVSTVTKTNRQYANQPPLPSPSDNPNPAPPPPPPEPRTPSSLRNNLSELDTMLDDLNSAQFMEEVDRKSSGYGSYSTVQTNGAAGAGAGAGSGVGVGGAARHAPLPVAPKPAPAATRRYESPTASSLSRVDRMLEELEKESPVITSPQNVQRHERTETSSTSFHNQRGPYVTSSNATRELDDLMASLSEFNLNPPSAGVGVGGGGIGGGSIGSGGIGGGSIGGGSIGGGGRSLVNDPPYAVTNKVGKIPTGANAAYHVQQSRTVQESSQQHSPLASPSMRSAPRSPMDSPSMRGPPYSPMDSPSMRGPPYSPMDLPSMRSTPRSPLDSPSMRGAPRSPLDSPSMRGAPRSPMDSPSMRGPPYSPMDSPSMRDAPRSPLDSPSMRPPESLAGRQVLVESSNLRQTQQQYQQQQQQQQQQDRFESPARQVNGQAVPAVQVQETCQGQLQVTSSVSEVDGNVEHQYGNQETVRKVQRDTLDTMMGQLDSDMQRQGVTTVPKGHCAACNKPIVGQVITALGMIWHPEHFCCCHCNEELGTRTFFEREGKPYCEDDYHALFSPRCAACNGPILDRCVTGLGRTWHPEHFCCAHCGRMFDDEGFHERNGKPYCREDYFEMFAPKCGGCVQPIVDNYISALNKQWHPECFICQDCHMPFSGGSFYDHDGMPFCETHYHAKRGSLCAGCQKPITGRCITAMYKKFHPEHFVCAFCLKQLNKGTFKEQNEKPYCHSCFVKLFG